MPIQTFPDGSQLDTDTGQVIRGATPGVNEPIKSSPGQSQTSGLTPEQIAELDIASQRIAAGNPGGATSNNAGDIANVEYAKSHYGYSYDPNKSSSAGGSSTGGTSSTSSKATKTDSTDLDKLMSALQNGYDNYQDLANATGLDINTVTNLANSNYNISSILNYNKSNNSNQLELDKVTKKMNDIANGIFTLTPEEQSQLDSATRNIEQVRAKLIEANQNYEGSVLRSGIRSGRQEFMNDVASSDYNKAIQDGIEKVRKYDDESAALLGRLKASFKDKKYKAASDQYDQLQKLMTEKSKQITDLQKMTKDYYDSVDKDLTTKLNQQKLLQTIGSKTITDIAPTIIDSLTGDDTQDEAIYSQLATYYDLDPLVVKGLLAKAKIDLGAKTKNTTKTVTVGSGKTAKKYLVTYDYQGKETKRELLGGGGGTGTGGGGGGTFNEKAAESEMRGAMAEVTGGDGYISPDDYTTLRKQWVDKGGNATTFDTKFKGYRNPNNPYYVTTKQ